MSETRQLAVQMLKDVIENNTFFSDVKNQNENTSSQDSAFINMLVLTALRHLVFIKKILKKFVKKKLPADVSFGEFALILGTVEILYMDTPDYAVINSYVNITKHNTNNYVGGFVNAVLRNVCKQKEQLMQEDNGEFFSAEFFKILNQDYGKKTIQKMQIASMLEPSLDLTAKENAQQLAKDLNAVLLPNNSLRLQNRGKITELSGYTQGLWWVQDFAASLAAQTLGNIKGQRVLDLCAAPGGKTAQLINAGANVTALDISQPRLKTLEENLTRLTLKCQDIVCADALDYLKNFQEEAFDAILLDAPCSATGTIRRHPELVHIKRLKDVEKLTILQKDFLQVVGNALKKDGILVYCVCSITKAEGENQILTFLESHPEFINLPIKASELFSQGNLDEIITPEGFIRTLPNHLLELGGTDAFFVARLKKVA